MPGQFTDDVDDVEDEFNDEFEEADEFADWEEVDISDGTTELMPPEDEYGFRDHVELIASASGAVGSIGPMTHEHREYICRFGDVYLVRSESDWGSSNTIVGRNASLEECVERSEAFVIGRGGIAGAWSDEDVDGDIDDEELWDPDEEDGEEDVLAPSRPGVSPLGLCRCVRGHRPPRGCPTRTISTPTYSQPERREFHERLWQTAITLGDVVIAGAGAAGELPANTTWFVIPCDADERAQLERVLGHVEVVTVEVDVERIQAAFTDRMAATTAARVGAAFGSDEVWQLDRDSIRTIRVDEPVVVARALRVR
jgi:hypothetical protein